jgi:hypothetical protein
MTGNQSTSNSKTAETLNKLQSNASRIANQILAQNSKDSCSKQVSAAKQIPSVTQASPNSVLIHVCDEAKKKTQDFRCDRTLLLSNMKYFEKYLNSQQSLEDIDISVHCDISIFDWLMKFVHGLKPDLEVKNSVSILISSDFLQMAGLVENSLCFVADHLEEIIQLPIDMNCMNSALVKRLANKVDVELLETLKDRKDKLRSKLYMKKLEILFQENSNML